MKRSRILTSTVTFFLLLSLLFFGCSSNDAGGNTPTQSNTSEHLTESSEITSDYKYEDGKLNVIFTIDVEDNRGNEPYLIEGDLSNFGVSDNCGVNYIMDTFESHNASAVFFVNIFEQGSYDKEYMPSLLRRISERGHEIGLHTHNPRDKFLECYNKVVSKMNQQEMEAVMSYGREYIFEATGKYPTSYRSGAYHANDNLFKALSNTGFLVDSSVYYGTENNLFKEYSNFKNQTFKIEGVTEFPVITVFNGKTWKKLDIDALSIDDIKSALEIMRTNGQYSTVQIMFHSFSFLDLKGSDGASPLLSDGDKNIYGENKKNKDALNELLGWLQSSEYYEITTFDGYLKSEQKIPEYQDDNLVYLSNKNIAFEKKDIEVIADKTSVSLKNNFKGDGKLSYAWVITSEKTNEYFEQSGYSENPEYKLEFSSSDTDRFYIKAYVKDFDGDKLSGQYYVVNVENGIVLSVEDY